MKYAFLFYVVAVCVLSVCSTSFAAPPPTALTDYELVAASQTTQSLGPVGGVGDVLDKCVIIPETTGAGTVAIKDGSDTAINILVAGTLSDLKPHVVLIGARSRVGAWQVTTGANVHVVCTGRFK